MPDLKERTAVIHIGLPKTATKTLQWRLFAQHSEIYYLGRFDGGPFAAQHRQFGACRDEPTFNIMEKIAYRDFLHPDLETARSLLRQYLTASNQENRVPVWSWESYSTDSYPNRQARAHNLKAVFREAKIIVTIRHPVKLLQSAFLQQLKRDNVGGRFERGKPLFYCSVDDWIERDFEEDISNHLDYPRTISTYMDLFGQENVCVLVFEDLLRDETAFYRKLCHHIGIDLNETLQLVAENVDNTRWSNTQLTRLREIDQSWIKSQRFRFSDRKSRKKMLGLDTSPNAQARAQVEISPRLKEGILERTREGNKCLDQTFGLGLKSLGYY